ncbi:MAG: FlgD immunoglobulin-like domain containing protein [Candidatus Krumholzibacteria bacterium]|nr:FlgD immunoglobulin-like domain containing protein [Candidatus Krumholzibacteria bacterium]
MSIRPIRSAHALFVLILLLPGIATALVAGDESWSSGFHAAGIDGTVQSMISWDGSVFVGGFFGAVRDVETDHVARLEFGAGTPSSIVGISPVGDGLDGYVVGFAGHDGQLHAAGYFNGSGDTVLNRVARWDGAAWHPLGDGLPGIYPRTIASYDGALYVDRYRWDGSSWTEVFPVNGRISTLTVHAGLLYACGEFSEVAGQAIGNVIAWDGSSILSVGGGVPWLQVEGAYSGADGLYVSGWDDFDLASGTNRWDGLAWQTEVDGGMATSMVVHEGDLYARMTYIEHFWYVRSHLMVRNGGTWQQVDAVSPQRMISHGSLLLGTMHPGALDNDTRTPGLVGFSAGSYHEVFPSDGFDRGFETLLGDATSLLAGGGSVQADGVIINVCALATGDTWVDYGDASSLAPGRFGDLENAAGHVFGEYFYMTGDFGQHGISYLNPADGSPSWELLSTPGWNDGVLQAVAGDLYSVAYNSLQTIGIDGSATNLPVPQTSTWFQGACDSQGDLVVCGPPTFADGNLLGNVLRDEAGSWASVGEALPGERVEIVQALDGSRLAAVVRMVGGDDTVWIFNGASWQQLPGEFNDSVDGLAWHRDHLFAAGEFTRVGPIWSPGIAVWSGSQWAPVGSGVNGAVTAIASGDNKLYVAGGFNQAGGQMVAGFAVWTGDPADLTGEPVSVPLVVAGDKALLRSPAPNPFNPRTWIRFELPQATQVQIDILDVRGHRVRRLANREFVAGPARLLWDGRNDGGESVATGVYFAQLQTRNHSESVKLVLIR